MRLCSAVWPLASLGAFLLLSASDWTAPSRFRLNVLDESGRPVAARLQALDSEGKPLALPNTPGLTPIHPRNTSLGVVINRAAEIELPPGAARVRIGRGAEYHPVEIAVKAGAGELKEQTATLQRWIHMAAKGWWSADLHVHRLPSDMPLLMEAADVHFAPVLTRWNDSSNLATWPERAVFDAGAARAYSVNNCEDERGWGAALFFGLASPPKLYSMKSNRDYPSPVAVMREARHKGAFIDLEKVIWWGSPVAAALVPPDSIGVALNHFLENTMLDQEAWGRPRDTGKYPGRAGFARYVFDLYYTYLNAGLRVPASAGSANGVIHNPLGYNRSYAYHEGRFTPERWWAAQKEGRNFVTNGPMLFLKVNGKLPGAVIEGAREVSVQIEAIAGSELESVELIVDGTVVRTLVASADPLRVFSSTKVPVKPGGWLAARCFQKSPATIRFAHTSPVYFGRAPRRSPEALDYLRAWVAADMDRITHLTGITGEQREELLALSRQALKAYQ